MIEPFSPVYFVIDRNHDIVRFSGADAGQYLEPTAGAASLNLFAILRRTLRPDVRTAVLAVIADRRGDRAENLVDQVPRAGAGTSR